MFQHQGAGAKHAFLPDRHTVPNRDVDADEATLTDPDPTRQDDVRCDEDVVLDYGVMTDMIAAPQRHIGADADKRLDCVVFQNEAVFIQLEAGKLGRSAAEIGHHSIAFRACSGDFFSSDRVDFGITDRDEKAEMLRRIRFGDPFERHDRAAAELRLLEVSLIDGEARDLEFEIVGEIEIGELCDVSNAEDDDLFFHFIPLQCAANWFALPALRKSTTTACLGMLS